MDCRRCGGLMVGDWFLDINDEAGRMKFDGLRCLICGEIVDSLILENRQKQLETSASK